MRVLLVNAPYDRIPETPPLGLAYIASVLREAGHNIRIVDGALRKYAKGDSLVAAIRDFAPDIVGISVFIVNVVGAQELAKKVKALLGVPIVFGGPHPSSIPLEILNTNPSVDAVVINEGEYAMRDLCAQMEQGKSFDGVDGVYFRNANGQIVQNALREPVRPLDSIPFPARDLLENSLYKTLPHQCKNTPAFSMITSRGCAYRKCTFCFEAGKFGSPFRRVAPERAIEEIKVLLTEYGAKEITFWDDNLTQGASWVTALCELILKENLQFSWSAFGHVNTVSPEMLRLMAKAGCWRIIYGIESGNQVLLDKIKKGITLDEVRDATRWTYEAGIESLGCFMLALPGETPEMGMKTIAFALELNIDHAVFACTNPLPGTLLFDACQEQGTIRPGEYGITRPYRAPFIPKGYESEEQVLRILRLAYRQFYSRPKHIMRFVARIRTPREFWRFVQGFLTLIRQRN